MSVAIPSIADESGIEVSSDAHPGAAIVEELINKACSLSSLRTQSVEVHAVDDDDDDDDDDEVTIVAQNVASIPQDDLVIVSDNLTRSRSNLPLNRQQAFPNSQTQVIDLEADIPVTLPNPNPNTQTTTKHDDVLLSSSSAPHPCTVSTSTCHQCNQLISHKTPLTRCKHVLCTTCCLRAVAHVENPSHRPITATNMLQLPVCTVPRCTAPLSRIEVSLALAPPLIDTSFAKCLEQFRQWQKRPSSHPVVGPASIVFPPYDPQPSPGDSNGSIEKTSSSLHHEADHALDFLVIDDFPAACAPLWVWDQEYELTPGRPGAWLCAACGEYCQASAVTLVSEPTTGSHDEQGTVGDPSVGDAPSHPHCAHARALGLLEYVRNLAESRLQEEPKKRKAPSRGSVATRKRYRSASSIRSHKRARRGFAKGTGYAGNTRNEWQGTSTRLIQRTARMDNEAAYWLSRVRCMLVLAPDASLISWPGFMRSLIRDCKLVSQLAAILVNESIMDVQERVPLFVSALRVVHALTEAPSLRMLVIEPIEGANGKNIAELVESLSRQAAFLTTGVSVDNLPPYTALLVKQIRRCIRVINRNNLIQLGRTKAQDEKPIDLDDVDDEPTDGNGTDSSPGFVQRKERVKSGEDICFKADKQAYLEQMKDHQFKTVPGLSQRSSFKAEADRAESFAAPHGTRQRRIAGEVASLFSSLPLSWSSTILLRADEDRYDFLRACIFGPEDTPYDSGAFIFDIYLPLQYPAVPPKFRLLTTGGGKVRFNPNLYNSGKVCLSLLGTWSGPSWNPASTILQVLVSIQSLILVSDPYFNEPGFERQMGSAAGKQNSQRYNDRVRRDTAFHAIQTNVNYPTSEFQEGIRTHFRLKRRYLKHMFVTWFPCARRSPDDDDQGGAIHNGKGAVPKVSIDPTLQSLSQQICIREGNLPVPTGIYPHPPLSAASVAENTVPSYGLGRNFRSLQISFAHLQRIVDDLDNI